MVERDIQRIRSLEDVAEASAADPQCLWAAQGLLAGGAAWACEGAVVVGCPALSGLDRLIVRGAAEPAADLVLAAVESLGPGYVLIGDPPLMASLLDRFSWLESCGYFGWMDGISRPPRRPLHSVRWLSRQEWPSADRVLRVATPDSFARPGVPGVRRWAGITNAAGSVTSIAADAWSAPGLGFVAGLAVMPAARGVGQGRDVCAFVLDKLMTAHGRVAMMVRDWSEAAIAIYSELGLTYRHQQVLRVRSGGSASS